MTSRPDPRAKELFLEALELDEGARAALLERLERDDAALAAEVRALLASHTAPAAAELERLPRALASWLGPRPPGKRLGDYELLEEIGAGAHGVVWRARQLSLGRIVALKVLRSGLLAHPREREQLRHEAEAIAHLDHPGIVPVHEIGEEDGHAFFSMRWIDGGSLAALPARPWPAHEAAALIAAVARAVHHAHQRGLLHRDLKPSNVLLDGEGRPFVADFGIAKRLDASGGASATGALAGTPAYMAPEQALGGELTVATDVWALGCLLYELLAARPAFGGRSVTEILRQVREGEPTPLAELRPDLPRDVVTIVEVCLRKEGPRRYASANALADDLERWLRHEPIEARRTGSLERIALFCKRSPLAASLIGITAGLLLVLAGVASWASLELGARLRDSYLDQARATRLVGDVGSRDRALELLERAARIRPGPDLRDEAIACLATTDLALVRSRPREGALAWQLIASPGLAQLLAFEEEQLSILERDGRVRRELGPLAGLRDARLSPDARWLLTRIESAPGRTRTQLLDLEREAVLLEREEDLPLGLSAFDPASGRLALGLPEGRVSLLSLPLGREELVLELGPRVRVLQFSPDGRRLAVGLESEPPRLEQRDTESGALLHEVELPAVPYALTWLGEGGGLAVGCTDFQVHVYERDADQPRTVCTGHTAEVVELFATPGGELLASHAWDETTRLWDTATGRQIRVASARALGFSADESELDFVDSESLGTWRIEHRDVLRILRAHEGKAPRDLEFAADGERLATAGADQVCLWDLGDSDGPQRRLPGPARSALFLPDGQHLLVSGSEGLWRHDLAGKRAPECLHPGWSGEAVLARDGSRVAALGRSELLLLDPREPARLRVLPGAERMEYLGISADGGCIVAGNWRGRGVQVWRPEVADEPRVLLPELVNVGVAVSPDGTRLAAASSESFQLWSLETDALLCTVDRWPAYGRAPAPVTFRPDGAVAAFAISSEVVRLIDVRTLENVATLEAPAPQNLFELTYSPDGSILAAACSTNRVQLWNLSALERELAALGLVGR